MSKNLVEAAVLPVTAHPFGGELDGGVSTAVNFPITQWHIFGVLAGAAVVLTSCGGETTPSATPIPTEPTVGLFPSIAQSVVKNIEFLIQNPLESFVTLGLSGATYGAIQLGVDVLKRGGGWTAETGKGLWGRIRKKNGGSEDGGEDEEGGETISLTPQESQQLTSFVVEFSTLVVGKTSQQDVQAAMRTAFYRAVLEPAREKSGTKVDLRKSLMKIPREAKQWLTAAAFGFMTIKFLQLYAPEISTSAKAAAAVFAMATLTAVTSLEALLPEGWNFTLARKKDQ